MDYQSIPKKLAKAMFYLFINYTHPSRMLVSSMNSTMMAKIFYDELFPTVDFYCHEKCFKRSLE